MEQHEVFNIDLLNKSAISQYKRRMPNFQNDKVPGPAVSNVINKRILCL